MRNEAAEASNLWNGYHQRGSLEHTLFGPFPRLVLVCINADFCDQGRIFQHFSSSTFFSFAPFQISVIFQAFAQFFATIWRIFCGFSKETADFANFRQISTDFSGILQNFNNFAKNDAKIAIFQRNLRKFAEKCAFSLSKTAKKAIV